MPKVPQLGTLQSVPKYFENENTDSSINNNYDTSLKLVIKDQHLKLLINEVVAHNLDLKTIYNQLEIDKATLSQSRSALFPTIGINANISGTKFGKYTIEGVGNDETNKTPNIDPNYKVSTDPTPNYLMGLTSSWELDFWGKLNNLKKAAKLRLLASTNGAHWIQNQIISQTSKLYFELIALDLELQIIDTNIKIQEKALEVVEIQKMGGRATELAVQQFRAQLLNTQNTQINLLQKRYEVGTQINQLRGKFADTIYRSNSLNFDIYFEDYIHNKLPIAMLSNRTDLLQAQYELKASNADVKATVAAFFPNISISGYTALNAFKSNLFFLPASLGYQVLGGLVLPIFNQKQLFTRFKISKANQKIAFNKYEKAAINAYQEVCTSLNNLEKYKNRIKLKAKEVEALENGVQISKDLYITGYATYLEIISAQKSLIESQINNIILQQQLLNTQVELHKSLGGYWDL